MTRDADRALGLVLDLTLTMADDMARSFERSGLTTARAHLLWLLHEGGPSTQKALAAALGVSPRNVTGLVDGLEAAGLVTRAPHPTDRRAALVSFTPEGEELVGQMARDQVLLADGLFGSMSPAELDAFTSTLEGVLGRLKAMIAVDQEGAPR